MYVNVSNVAMAVTVAESVKIKTKLAWNFQTEEKFELQHFYILLLFIVSLFCSPIHVAEGLIGLLSTVLLSKIFLVTIVVF